MDSSATDSPHTYVIPPKKRRLYKIVGWSGVAFGFGAMGSFWTMILKESHGRNPATMLLLFTLFFCMPVAEGLLVVRGATRVAVTLTPATIQIHGLLRDRELPLSAITGRCRRLGRDSIITYLIFDADSHRSRARLPDDVAYDETFNRWLASVPDLDAIAKEKRRAEGKLHWWED